MSKNYKNLQLKRKKEAILDFAGIFTNSYMVWDDMAEAKNKPTIAEMAKTAVNFLQAKAGQEGFFIMIEVGASWNQIGRE